MATRPWAMKQKSSARKRRAPYQGRSPPTGFGACEVGGVNSLNSADAMRDNRHARAVDEFVDWYCSEPLLALNRTVVLRYRSHLESRQLAPGAINSRLGTVRRLAYEAADCGLLSAGLAAGIRRVKYVKKLGLHLGDRLSIVNDPKRHWGPCHELQAPGTGGADNCPAGTLSMGASPGSDSRTGQPRSGQMGHALFIA
jgi:hypothetical protein